MKVWLKQVLDIVLPCHYDSTKSSEVKTCRLFSMSIELCGDSPPNVQARKFDGRRSNSRTCEKRSLKSRIITVQPDFTSWQSLEMSFLENDDGLAVWLWGLKE